MIKPFIYFNKFKPLHNTILKMQSLKHVISNVRLFSVVKPDKQNLKAYQELSKQWWANSETDPLFLMNQVRVPLIRDALLDSIENNEKYVNKSLPLQGISLLDIGCGVGFLTEALARLGANMTSIDPEPENIKHALIHLENDSDIQERINYKCCYSEDLLPEYFETFDGVIASEVIEHTENPENFVNTAIDLAKENGSLFFTTINRTWLSYISAIIIAEKVLKIVPSNIHEWEHFIKPEELKTWLESRNCHVQLIHGMKYNPLTKTFSWCKDISDNYALYATKFKK